VGWFRDRLLTWLPIREVRQCGALPYRRAADGRVEVLLVTARRGSRWLTPKGWPSRVHSHARSAQREAYEEAGVRGGIEPRPCGAFRHRKVLSSRKAIDCLIDVYLLAVEVELDDWPEKAERRRRWFDLDEAADAVDNLTLRRLLERLARERPFA